MCNLENVLHDLDIKFDIIAISETWLHSESNLSLFETSGYDHCNVDRKGKKGDGVALYVKNDDDYKVSDNLSLTITENTEFLTIDLNNKQSKNIIISYIYRQPGIDIKILSNIIEELFKSKRSNMYLCGDFNINLLNYKDNSYIKHFTDMLFSLEFFQLLINLVIYLLQQ